ncbi:unnamed protein product [marine sediment metagenome]|uniref:Uncharacterized protein n=1 Tax=marine sediment metagenome TaxID=412755 RepID=X0SIB8_9ZZZZ
MKLLYYKAGMIWKKMESLMAPVFKGEVCEESGTLCPYLNYDDGFCHRFECDVEETYEMERTRCGECVTKFGDAV